ncbi:hypothetical protein RB623_18965 [Mesorhizobium sp. LHD-90]|uniref:hypothetical protein n=1 Tax=Mesorhizobium sp. LHD-90 TaxID=3071414 RepID=UPI0027E06785|nr:hypothetical protein [Mesorhizobium sp. LHD-90]MDQ6436144.1 hypothetical protein [Mesorhizobium sp. LHD-90]
MTPLPSTSSMTKSRLSELALEAAIQLDQVTQSRSAATVSIDRFFQAVREQLDQDEHKVVKDQTLVPVYAFALSQGGTDSYTPRATLSGLLQDVLQNYESVDNAAERPTDQQLAFLRDFCLAVHEALIANLMGSRIAAVRRDERARYN